MSNPTASPASPRHPIPPLPRHGNPVTPSAKRAWLYLVWFCVQRQAVSRQMLGIALLLLGFTAAVVALNTAADRWGMGHWRWRLPEVSAASNNLRQPTDGGTKAASQPPGAVRFTYEETAQAMEIAAQAWPWSPPAASVQTAVSGASRGLLDRSGFLVFSGWIVFSVYLSFLLPILSLSFATEAVGGERESGNLVWLLSRPVPRPAVYVAKFAALLPWSLGLNVGGFGVLCLAAGEAGLAAFRLYWPAVLAASLAFTALFQLIGACFRRPAVVAIVYSFFLETILGNMPGYMKRVSLNFYTRCLMYDLAEGYGVQPENPSVYLPVSGPVAAAVLMGTAFALVGVGMVVFARREYRAEV